MRGGAPRAARARAALICVMLVALCSYPHGVDARSATHVRRSADVLITGFGDASGYHLDVARAYDDYQWHQVALLSPGSISADAWSGFQCLSGDGRYAAVAIMPTLSANDPALEAHGAFGYVVDLTTGAVRAALSDVASTYHSPGCGSGDRAVFVAYPDANERSTDVSIVDMASGAVTFFSGSQSGELSSVVPERGGVVAALGSRLLRLRFQTWGRPVVIAKAAGLIYDVRAADGGAVDYLTTTLGARVARAGAIGEARGADCDRATGTAKALSGAERASGADW